MNYDEEEEEDHDVDRTEESPATVRSSQDTTKASAPQQLQVDEETSTESSLSAKDTTSPNSHSPSHTAPNPSAGKPQSEADHHAEKQDGEREMQQPKKGSINSDPSLDAKLENNKDMSNTSGPESPSPSFSPRQKSYREVQFEKVMSANVVNMEELRKLSWNGVPPSHRALAWKILLGYVPTNRSRRQASLQRKRAEYRDAIAQHYDIDDDSRTAQEQETLRQVLVDVPRTAPEVPLFRNDRIRRLLSRLLYIWAMRHPASSYVQGINDLATPLLVVFLSEYYEGENVLDGQVMNQIADTQLHELEADVYGCLTNLLAGIQDHYTSDQPGVQRMVMRLEELVQRIDGDLCQHLSETGIEFIQFAFKWMNCLLLREFELPCVVRLWDTYISEQDNGFEGFHVYVCAAFLCQFSAQLQAMSFDELFAFMQAMPTSDWGDTEIEMLLSQAYVLSTLFGGSDAHLTANTPRM